MTLYFDIRVQNPETSSINTLSSWHNNFPLLAVGSYSQDKGGFVIVYDDQGEPLQDVESSPGDSLSQVTALCWHPEKRLLISGWETGELKIWPGDSGTCEYKITATPHKDPLSILQWSQNGGRFVSADTAGSIVGWKIDTRGQLFVTFHHELKESFTHIIFKLSQTTTTTTTSTATTSKQSMDITELAKAAVAGDERALDLFSTWRPRTAHTTINNQKDNHAFYIGSTSGTIYYIDAPGQCIEVLNTGGLNILCMLYHQTRDSIVILTEGLNIANYQVDSSTGRLTELTRVKLNGKGDISRLGPVLCWIKTNTIAILTGDIGIRCWDVYTGDTYVLQPPESLTGNIATPQEICTSLSYCKYNETLAAGTNLGTIYLWKKKNSSTTDEYGWPIIPNTCTVHGTVKQLTWGGTLLRNPLIAVNCLTNVFILHQQTMCAVYNEDICASQIAPMQILIEIDKKSCTLKTDLQVQILGINKNYIAVSSCRQIGVYKIIHNTDNINTIVIGTFNCDTEKILIYDNVLIILTPIVIQLRSLDGIIIQTLQTLPEEGEPITMELTGKYLTVASLNGILKIWDVGKREAKLHTRALTVYEAIDDFAEIIEAKCNADCRCVSITIAMTNLMPSSILYVWDIEGDQIYEFDFSKLEINNEQTNSNVKLKSRLVTAHYWDTNEPRVLICRAQKIDKKKNSLSKKKPDNNHDNDNVLLVSLFATPDNGITVQDIRPIKDQNCRLLGVQCPDIILLNPDMAITDGSKITKLLMHEFEELGNCDDNIKKAIMDFSYYISMSNMDEAFKSIKTIKNQNVWKSLAKMCVKTKQFDMAVLCLGHMKHVRGSRALRQSMQDSSLNIDAKIGILAVELELYNDAERLFRESNRLDLLGYLYESSNKYTDAIKLAKNENKIREKLSYFNYAKALESNRDIDKAIEMYTKADCHRFEVPRILLNRPQELYSYLSNSDDPAIKKWHAQYVESKGDMEGALRLYEAANDTLGVTRILCYLGREEEVNELVMKTNHAVSAYHLASHYDSLNDPQQAVHFYTIAKAYNNAIRICKEHNMTEELWPLAMLASKQIQFDVAKYYEENDKPDKAVLLYHKAGMIPKALDLAFSTQQYDALQLITMDVNAHSDPSLILKCADFFVKNNQIEKGVDLLATGKNYLQALDLIQENNITMTDELAEKLTINKIDNDMENDDFRIKILERIGEIAFNQSNYHLSTKKFTQAGNKLRAMKALLKSGDTEKICFFAQVSRQRDIYIMAGNYLQSLDWQNKPEILKNIISFYSKGKAMDLLANFYVACGQVEIDEFQNYDKALDAINQASKCLSKVTTPRDPEIQKRAIEVVNTRMNIIKRYLDIKKMFNRGDTDMAIAQVRQLLDAYGNNLEESVRRGDLFSTITQHYADNGNIEKARASIEELKRLVPDINLTYYYNENLLELLGYQINVQREESIDNDDGIEELLGE